MQLYDLKHGRRWAEMTREEFNLTPPELATLVAVVAFCAVHDGAPMPREELDRVAAEWESDPVYRLDPTTPGRLARMGLIELHGYRERRSYSPTPAGIRRARQ